MEELLITCCCSVAKSCQTLWDLTDCSMSGFPSLSFTISWSLLKFMSIELVMLSNHLILAAHFSSCPQSFPVSGSFPRSQFFASGGQSIGASASASVFPMNIQGWFPVGLTGLILLSKGLSRVFSSVTSLKRSVLWHSAVTSVHNYWKNHSFDYTDFCQQSNVLLFNTLSLS